MLQIIENLIAEHLAFYRYSGIIHPEQPALSHENHVDAGNWASRLGGSMSEQPLRPIARRRVPELLSCNISDAAVAAALLGCCTCYEDEAVGLISPASLEQGVDLGLALNRSPHRADLDAKLLALLPPARSEDPTATLGGHAGPEAMALGPFPLVRLISSLHVALPSKSLN